MNDELWTTVIVRPQHGGYNAPGSSFGNPVALQTTRALYEGPLQKQVEQAQAAFDSALALVQAGESVKVVTEAEWKRVAAQATEPARREKVRLYSERRRAADAERKRRRAEEREAAKANGATQAEALLPCGHPESDAHVSDEGTAFCQRCAEEMQDDDLALATAGADTHEPAGDEEQDR